MKRTYKHTIARWSILWLLSAMIVLLTVGIGYGLYNAFMESIVAGIALSVFLIPIGLVAIIWFSSEIEDIYRDDY